MTKKKLKRAIYDISDKGYLQVRCPHCKSWNRFWFEPLFEFNAHKLPVEQVCEFNHGVGCKKKFLIEALTPEEELKKTKGELKELKESLNNKFSRIRSLETKVQKLEDTPWSKVVKRLEKIVDLKPKDVRRKAKEKVFQARDMVLFRRMNRLAIENIEDLRTFNGVVIRPEKITVKVIPTKAGKVFGYKSYRVQYIKDTTDGWIRTCSRRIRASKNFEGFLNKSLHDYKEGY